MTPSSVCTYFVLRTPGRLTLSQQQSIFVRISRWHRFDLTESCQGMGEALDVPGARELDDGS